MDDQDFVPDPTAYNPTISELIKESYDTAKSHGFWDGDDKPNIAEKIALMHSELSEALEDVRSGQLVSEIYYTVEYRNGKPEGVPVELADLLIRVFDFCGYYDVPLVEALRVKMEYNKDRPRKHGKEF